MKIGIDISQIIYNTGVSVYTKKLVEGLLKLDGADEYVLFGGSLRQYSNLKSLVSQLRGNYKEKLFPLPPTLSDILFNVVRVPSIEMFTGKLDVFHSSDWTQPRSSAHKVTTIHDLAPIRFPRHTHPRIVSVHQRRLEVVKKEVDRVIVPSIFTKMDLVDFGFDQEKIRVIPEAPQYTYDFPKFKIESVKKKYKLAGDYLITIGVGERKNTKRLITAFEKVRGGHDLKLVLIGGQKLGDDLPRGVIPLGHVPDEDFPVLIKGAQALVYPSIYEGFGLPILEAFSAGVPVVTSNVSSLPEVCGDAAILIDPYDSDAISYGIVQAFKNSDKLIERGLKRVKEFTWEKTSRMTMEVYNELAGNKENKS